MTAIKKNKALGADRAALNSYLYDISGYNLSDLRHSHMAMIDNFKQAAMFARYDTVHYLTGIVPNMTQIHGQPPAPQILSTKLTRTETERYTDSNGNRSRRKRIINVFEGFLLVQTLPEFESENRIVITSRQMWSFEGPFARHLQGRSTKIDEIQTSSLEFNRLFKVNCDDATLAHHFLDPVRIMRFLNLNDDLRAMLGRKKIGLSLLITRGQVWIALEGKGLNKMAEFSGNPDKFSQELSQHLGPAILPHIIAQHLQFNPPAPYS